MSRSFRHIICAAAAIGAFAASGVALAAFPDHALTVIVPTPPGGPIDRVARTLARGMEQVLGQPVVVDNRLGAAGKIGVQAALRAPRDGYTLLAVSPSITSVNPLVDKAVGYDPLKDFEALGVAAVNAGVVAVRADLPVASLAELVKYAKANPNKLTYASFGVGTSLHLQTEELLQALGISARHIPYKGEAQALNALVAGEVDLMAYVTATAVPFVENGRLRALATTSSTRWALLPQVPAFAETGIPALKGYDYHSWVGLALPAGVPAAASARIAAAYRAALAQPEVKRSLEAQGFSTGTGGADAMRRTIADELARNKRLIDSGRVTLE